ncbi:MAG: RHS repeat-associated core domain-containing protein [Burkholderiales bacterium]
MMRLARHLIVLMKVGIAVACVSLTALWPAALQAQNIIGCRSDDECPLNQDGSEQPCVCSEEGGKTFCGCQVSVTEPPLDCEFPCLSDEICVSGECVQLPEPPEQPPPEQPPPEQPPPEQPPPEQPPPEQPPPEQPPPEQPPPPKPSRVDDPCLEAGSIIAAQNQSLGEAVDLVGTPFRLHYQSDRVPGRADVHAVAVIHAQPLGGWTVSAHHALDPAGPTLFLGDGGRRSAEALGSLAQTAAGEFIIAAEAGHEIYVFDTSGRHLHTLHPLTGATRYQFSYDGAGHLAAITDGDGNVTTVERDAAGVPIAIVGPFGQRTTLTLDANGYLASITNPAGETVQFGYAPGGLLGNLTDPRGGVYAFSHDAAGRLLQNDDPAGGSKTLARTEDATGYTVRLSTALGRTTSYTVERPPEEGERQLITLPSGLRTEWLKGPNDTRTTRLPDGTRLAVTPGPDPRWGLQVLLPARYTLSVPSGLVATTTTSRAVALADLDNPLSLISQTDTVGVNGRTYTRLYEAAARTFTDTTPAGRSRTTTLDAQGRLIGEQVAGLLPASYAYDARGRLANIARGNGAKARTTSLRYDDAGHLARLTDPLGRTTSFGYDAAGRVITEALPDGRVLGHAYDANGNLAALKPPGRPAHRFGYTPVGLLAAYQPPEVGNGAPPTLYTYDADRHLTEVMRPDGQSVKIKYDSAGRRMSLTSPRGPLQYTYDQTTGTLAAMTAPEGITVTYSYDGQLPTGESWVGPITGSVASTYDVDLRVTAQHLNGSNPISFEYDAEGLLMRAGDLLLVRDPQTGLRTGTILGSLTESLTYNGFGEVTSTNVGSGGFLYAAEYTRDPLGRLTQKTETLWGVTATDTYTYDVAGRLIAVARNRRHLATYTYDVNGNRLRAAGPKGTVTASYDAQDRLLRYGRTTYTYTPSGELRSRTTNGQTTTYDYDALGNLLGVTLPDGMQLTYLVDGRNRRLGKQVNGTLVQGWLYDGQWRIVAELDGSGNVMSRYVYGDRVNVPAYMLKGEVTYRIITDHLGSPRLIVNTVTGEIIQRMDYDEFGNILKDTNPGIQPFGFAGGLYDQHTKLVRFGARDYDAATGRWTARDPSPFAGANLNLYEYADNDPVNLVDLTGFSPVPPEYGFMDRVRSWIGGKLLEAVVGGKEIEHKTGEPKGTATERVEKKGPKSKDVEKRCSGGEEEPETEEDSAEDTSLRSIIVAGVVVGLGSLSSYAVYRTVRMIPSVVIPPLWPTIPANIIVP